MDFYNKGIKVFLFCFFLITLIHYLGLGYPMTEEQFIIAVNGFPSDNMIGEIDLSDKILTYIYVSVISYGFFWYLPQVFRIGYKKP